MFYTCFKSDVKKIQESLNISITVETEHPYSLNLKTKPTIHKKKGSKYKEGRKSEVSKKKKKRWY